MADVGTDTLQILQHQLTLQLGTPESRLAFVRNIWQRRNQQSLTTEHLQPTNFKAYFGFYHDQCMAWVREESSEGKTHRQLIEKACEIRSLNAQQLTTLLLSHDEKGRSWMFLAVRVLTMIDVGGLRRSMKLGQVSRSWTHGSLKDFIDSTFPSTKELSDNVKLERLFTARNIEWIADIQVIWTSNLADHLQLEDDDTKVRIFSHATFLELHREW